MMKLDKVGKDFVRQQEGLKLTAYRDRSGKWTILWGFTINPFTGHAIKEGDVIHDMTTAEQWWDKLEKDFDLTINSAIRVPISIGKITQNMYNALFSLCWNIGQTAFINSTLVKYINNGMNISPITIQSDDIYKQVVQFQKSAIAYWFLVFHMDNGVIVPDLLARRKLEIKLYYS